MKKQKKGTPGYLEYKKKIEIIRTIIYFLLVAAVYLLGYSQTHSNKNLLTVVAVVGCLPACKALVGVITRLPYPSIDPERAREVKELCPHMTVVFDLVVTSRDKIMPIDVLVISGNKVFGHLSGKKADPQYTEKHIKSILLENHFKEISVKMYPDYKKFLSRVEGLENIAAVEKEDTMEYEAKIRHLIQLISL